MANVLGIGGLNTSSGTNKLIAAFGNDLVDVDTGTGYSLNLTSTNNNEFESFLDSLFWQNFNHTPLTFDGTNWTNLHVKHTPISKYLKLFGVRMYLGYVKINSTEYPSRVMFSGLPTVDGEGNQTIQWEFQSGTNGSVTAGTNIFSAANAGFVTYGLKVGDPLIIESGDNAGEYTIQEIVHDTFVRTTTNFTATQSSITYWAGSNWFDVKTNDSDVITWVDQSTNRLLLFKQDSLHRFDGTNQLKELSGLPGTNSGRSVQNIRGASIYFHGSERDRTGFYLYDGRDSIRISNKIQPYIDAISTSNYNAIVSWREGDTYRAYAGDLSNSHSSNDSYNISMSNSVFSYDLANNTWTVDPIKDVIKCSGTFKESNQEKIFFGNTESEVIQTPSGYSFNGDDIAMALETNPIYPKGSEVVNIFTRVRIIARDCGRVNVTYKLWGTPFEVDQKWNGLGQLQKDMTELRIPLSHAKASGIQFRFEEIGSKEPVPTIEKIAIYSYPDLITLPEIGQLK